YLLHFFFPVTPPPYISTLSLHDALPICLRFIDRTLLVAVLAGTIHSKSGGCYMRAQSIALLVLLTAVQASAEQSTADESAQLRRSEEHTSELQSRENLVCRLLLEKKKKK